MELEGFRKREQELSKREEEIKSREDKIRSTEELIIAQREELDRKIQEMDRVSEKGTKEDASLQMNVQEVPGKEEQISPRVQESSHHQPSASCGTPIDAQLNVVEHKELVQDASEPTPTESINGAQDIGESVASERKVILAQDMKVKEGLLSTLQLVCRAATASRGTAKGIIEHDRGTG